MSNLYERSKNTFRFCNLKKKAGDHSRKLNVEKPAVRDCVRTWLFISEKVDSQGSLLRITHTQEYASNFF